MPAGRVVVGSVTRAHGVRGATLVTPLTDAPGTRFVAGAVFGTDDGRSLTVRRVSDHPSGLLVEFVGVDDRDAARSLAGTGLTIDAAERRMLGEGEYWPDELVGCTVVDRGGTTLGLVVGHVFGAAQDRLVVEAPGGLREEVPFVDDLVPVVDIGARLVVVDLPEGLLRGE